MSLRLAISVALVFLLVLEAKAEVVWLNSKDLCHLKVGGFKLENVMVYAHRSDMRSVLVRSTILNAHSCAALLTGEDEPTYIMERNVATLPSGSKHIDLTAGAIAIEMVDAVQFVELYRHLSARTAASSPTAPSPPPNSPPGQQGDNLIGGGNDCDFDNQVCVNDTGETSFSVSCGGLSYGISTNGNVSIGVGGKYGGLTVQTPGF